MSAGGVFKLIANDGKADRLIMATKLLNQRIKDTMCARRRAGKADITPTLVDLERTHVLYVNAHFKPYAAIGYEYNKSRPQSGSAVLGSGVTFSIAQFGDFFNDMVIRVRLGQVRSSLLQTPALGSAAFPLNTFDADTGVNVSHNLVDALGNVLVGGRSTLQSPPSPANYYNLVRYAEYPGNRLFRKVKFDVNGNPLDEYNESVSLMLEKFTVTPNKRVGYDRLAGQEVPREGYGPLRACPVVDSDAANTPAGISANSSPNSMPVGALFVAGPEAAVPTATTTTASAFPGLGVFGQLQQAVAAVNQLSPIAGGDAATLDPVSFCRQKLQFVDGPQTPKPIQPALEIWHKLKFWFNEDVRLSIASVSIPFGQRYISVELDQQQNLIYEFPGLYLETIVEAPGSMVSNIAGVPPYSGAEAATRSKTYTPIWQRGTIEPLNIERIEMYVNNIFVNPEIHDIYIKRIGFTLIRVYRWHIQRVNSSGSDERLLSQLKWPVEYMMIGLRPVWNITDVTTGAAGLVTGGNPQVWRDWHRLTRLLDAECAETQRAEISAKAWATSALPVVTLNNSGGSTLALNGNAWASSAIDSVTRTSWAMPLHTVDSMGLTAHGITIYEDFGDKFYNAYQPNHYGGAALVTPYDEGALFMNFALFPRSYQPSGHLNISRARETYLKWSSQYIGPSTPADLLCIAVAINFLLITDGSAVLRYST